MAQTGQKRGPGRPPKSAYAPKKQRLSTSTTQAPSSPAVDSPIHAAADVEKDIPRLPAKITDGKPLPTLPEPLPLPVSDAEYQSIAASAVLSSSLDRSRLRWVHDGVLERYWVKPETGKHAKPPPPNNPELKWMKHRGHCRIRIEPHIFECDVYVEAKVKPQPPPKQYVHANAYAQPYRPPAQNQQPYAQPYNQHPQNRAPPPVQQHGGHNTPANAHSIPQVQQPGTINPQLPPPQTQAAQAPQASTIATPAPAQQTDKKPPPDPVISMLASRASSDPELKALMKEVATGNANQGQLQVFQRHIDELTVIVQRQRKAEEERLAKEQQANVIRYDEPADRKPAPQIQQPQHHVPQRPYQPPPPPPPQPPPPTYRQPAWTPPAPASLPVILGFTTPGASEDRFLFPQHSILESLSPQHTLVSFIVTRKGKEAPDPSGLDPETEYWQPVTMMVEVAYGREEILACIRRWAKPAEDVRKHMEEVIGRCERVPQTYLALRLPFKSTVVAEAEDTPKEGTPIVAEKVRSKPNKQTKKAVTATQATVASSEAVPTKLGEDDAQTNDPPRASTGATGPQPANSINVENATMSDKTEGAIGDATTNPATTQNTEDTDRPKRPVRKSVRISEA